MTVIALRSRTPLVELLPTDPLAHLTDSARDEALRCYAVIRPALDRVRNGVSIRAAAEWLHQTGAGTMPSRQTIERWVSDYKRGGMVALAPAYKGRQRQQGGWELIARNYFILPSHLGMATIAEKLRDEHGFADATVSRVTTFLQALPAHEGEFHPQRVGPHYRRQNLTPHKIRDRGTVPVGLIYQGDGHSLHYYVQHYNSGHHFTAELTPWMDIGSRYITGWWLGESESAVQSLYSLSDALVRHDHVMAMLHVDPGSGFKNKLMCDEVSGFAPRIGAQFMTALPGNARGKGDIEGWFRWFEEKHGKFQPSYKGKEVAQEYLRRLEQRIAKREMYIPTWDEALEGIAKYIKAYNERNQDNLGCKSPAALWEKLERYPVNIPREVLAHPRERRTARSYDVRIFNRTYRAPALKAYEGQEVQVEYNLHNDKRVWIYDLAGRYVTEALLQSAQGWMPESRIADLRNKQQASALARLERRAELLRDRGHAAIETSRIGEALDAPVRELPRAPTSSAVGHAESQRVLDAIAEDQLVSETPEQRFARWLALTNHTEAISDADVRWLANYESTSEFRGQYAVWEEFQQE